MFVLIVTIHPPGPLYLPISMQRNITCSGGRQLTFLYVLFSNKTVVYDIVKGSEFVTGIVITSVSAGLTRLLISVNTNDTSVTGIRCHSTIRINNQITEVSKALNLTIYGK